jgi:D-aspartate ligase
MSKRSHDKSAYHDAARQMPGQANRTHSQTMTDPDSTPNTDPSNLEGPACRGVLLTMGSYHGTLAAARDLGLQGVTVVLADHRTDTVTHASRHVARRLLSPDVMQPLAFMAWLLDFGKSEPGFVLYPTCDELCWLMDKHREALAEFFYIYQPPQGQVYQLLNKKLLYQVCCELGIDQPAMWSTQTPNPSDKELAAVHYPVLLKPQTQAALLVQIKGVLINTPQALRAALDPARAKFQFHPALVAGDPSVETPLIQQYFELADRNIYSLAGFYAPETDSYLLRASLKTLQQPLRIGIGLCFESRPVHERTAAQLRALMDAVGYKGAFEAEFIHLESEDRFLLIDFNTRFYGQMGFEIARGIPTAQLCFHAAQADWAQVSALASSSRQWDHQVIWKCRIAWMLRFYTTTLWLGGGMSRCRRAEWIGWAESGNTYDPIVTKEDPKPARLFLKKVLLNMLRYPRASFRKYFLS